MNTINKITTMPTIIETTADVATVSTYKLYIH
jgi:hypothetical protein